MSDPSQPTGQLRPLLATPLEKFRILTLPYPSDTFKTLAGGLVPKAYI